MKTGKQFMLLGAAALLLCLGSGKIVAQQGQGQGQGPGNFDPQQFRQRMMERFKERLDVTSDDEWKVLQDRIEKVQQAQREARIVGFGGGGFGARRGGGDGAPADAAGGRRGNRGGFAGEPNPDAEALQKALDGKASTD